MVAFSLRSSLCSFLTASCIPIAWCQTPATLSANSLEPKDVRTRPAANPSGLSYTGTTRTVDKVSGRTTELTFRVWAMGTNMRAELEPSAKSTTPGYFLSHENGREVLLVQPSRGVYSKLDTGVLHHKQPSRGQSTDGVSSPARMTISIVVKGGGHVLGFPVTHYKFRGSFPVPYGTDLKQSTTAQVDGDIWTTKAINSPCAGQNDQNAVCLFISQFQQTNVQHEIEIGGFPLKAEATIQLSAPNGAMRKIQVYTEVSQLNVTDIPDSVFQLPDGFQEVRGTSPPVPAPPHK